ncbi:uncharacterized protein PV09_08823 [Verruconis gallopava]|uniref:Cation efflux protein n=1 Tax=Verruconis gallopava TaxID=253628 RepID=A0A0D1ZYN7_9PEZI|nr:uncharacterized protein PV09_08823 [Verruconis gallopava]KIV99517.1 hypothetical protein PV09_08823 [Verruconis gallopava]
MALSKSRRIQILLAIDGIFFLIELIIGYAVHSLALVADSFHMLNDVLSLCVGLWAVKVANSKQRSKMYTYGWQRAETLGALVNGVFLVALCLSIFLEAIQRFFEPQEVSHPQLILIVGCFGLASNILGLFLFHDHSHGGHGHSHGHSHGSDEIADAEEGHAHNHSSQSHFHDTESTVVADERGNVADVLPQSQVGNWSTASPAETKKHVSYGSLTPRTEGISFKNASSPSATSRRARRRSRSLSRGYANINEMPIHPASFRNEIIAASRLEDIQSGSSTDTDGENEEAIEDEGDDDHGPTEGSPLLGKKSNVISKRSTRGRRRNHRNSLSNGALHSSHNHNKPKKSSEDGGAHGHSHADLNMRGVFLHVLGDALGNVGVIASALFIWLTDFSWRFYSDPVISLIITVIILGSAIPLCKAASRILLQAVPAGLSIDDIKQDITDLPDVVSCHHLHVWQLSDTKLVASLHVQVAFEFKGEGSQRYMQLARQIRKCLHAYGIHSSTIQPEFCCEATHGHRMIERAIQHRDDDEDSCDQSHSGADDDYGCLLDCDDECGDGGMCCPVGSKKGCAGGKAGGKSIENGNGKSHDHDHDHAH